MQTATGTSQKESNDVGDDNDGKVLNGEACRGRGQRNVLILDTSSSKESQEEDVHGRPEAKHAMRYL